MDMKADIRKQVIACRNAIPPRMRASKSELIGSRLMAYLSDSLGTHAPEALKGKVVAVYQAMKSEPSLDTFICAAYEVKAQVCFPCMMKRPNPAEGEIGTPALSCSMVFRAVEKRRYESGAIPFAANPLKGFSSDDPLIRDYPLVPPSDIDIVIVPLVAFDSECNRLGYGGGNYDRLLPQLREDAIIVGVAFCEQQVEEVPTDELDYPLPCIVSA